MAIDSAQFVHTADSAQLHMQIRFPGRQKVGRKEIIVLTPRLVSSTDSLNLPSIGLYGRTPWLYAVRSGRFLFQGSDDVILNARDKKRLRAPMSYVRSVPYAPWLEGAEVRIDVTRMTCCGDISDENSWQVVSRQQMTVPAETIYHTRKETSGGTAHVDFIVNRIELRRDYHDNWRELDKISHLIDSIQELPHTRIDTITLHGYASPEGPYDNNVYLAKNRVKALAHYLAEHHSLDSAIISQRYTPEDWAGLRRWVEASDLRYRRQILEIIDDTLSEPDPDLHLKIIKQRFPNDYFIILMRCMPYLRHTEYTIQYTTTVDSEEVIPGRTVDHLPEQPAVPNTPPERFATRRPLVALKTNLVNDLALWPNVELEVPFGPDYQWSIMAEWGSPWYVWHHNSRAYEILNVGIEGRRWFGRCPACRPVLTGTFVGVYGAAGKFDLEWNSRGNQGEYGSVGLSAGHSWALLPSLNLEVSGSAGVIFGRRRRYHGEFNDTHLIWKHFGSVFYAGPTQLKVSLVWLLPRKWFGLEENEKMRK